MFTPEQYDDHSYMLEQLKKAQDADSDNRDKVREVQAFLNKEGGQWEDHLWRAADGKPRYTYDLSTPIIDQISGAMERSDFDVKVSPAGGEATKDIAQTYDGLVRNIETLSNATQIYNASGRRMVSTGMDGWRIVQKYADGDSFDQDLMVERVGNFVDRVWFGSFEEPDASDSTEAWVLTGMDKEEHKRRYPDASAAPIGIDKKANFYFHRKDLIPVGEFLYIKEVPRELILMSNDAVYEASEDFDKIVDELRELGITEVRRRQRKKRITCTREFDNSGWLGKAKETVFEWIPVVPCFVNFDVIEDKIIYWGAIEKIMDPARVFNYSISREVMEGALAPIPKTWGTEAQRLGHNGTINTLNTNSDPWQDYNHVDGVPPPFQVGGAQINPGLRGVSETARAVIGQSAGMFAASMGDNPGLQSGVAIDRLQDKGDTGNNKYSTAREVAQAHTGRILVKAIPKVYTPGRQVRILKEDGSFDITTIGQAVIDNDTQKEVLLNDLSAGIYDVAVSSGPSFKNRQSEAVTALTDLGAVDPSVIELGGDILLKNIAAPGMSALGDRKRALLLRQGVIPPDQWTDEEKAAAEQAQQEAQNQPPQEDPMMIAARAEETKAQADMLDAQNKQQQITMEGQNKQQAIQIDLMNAQTSRLEAQIKHAEALADIKGKGAQAAKVLAEAEAQDIENDLTLAGVSKLVEKMGQANG